jgi:hypothetical protein
MAGPAKRRALLLGCNSEGLEHCERDAQQLQEALTRCGFQAGTLLAADIRQGCGVPSNGFNQGWSPKSFVSEAIHRFLASCQRGDTAVVYFSGHSRFAHDVFSLVVGEDPGDPGHLLNVRALATQFEEHHKPAERLLILDCCEAEAAASDAFWSQAAGTWGRIWVAARTNEHAQELDGETNGGLFTALILRAITDEAPRLADAAGCLKIGDADRFIRDETAKYPSKTGRPPPRSGLYGNTGHDILLAEGLRVPPATGFSPEALAVLGALLRASGVADAVLARHYGDVLARSGLFAADGYRGPTGTYQAVGLKGALSNLAEAWHRPFHRVQVPLAEFVELVARSSTNGLELRAWLHDSLQSLAGDRDADAFIASLDLGQTLNAAVRIEPKSHLAVVVSPRDANEQTQYDVEIRLVDARGSVSSVHATVDPEPIHGLPTIMQRALNANGVLEAMKALDRPFAIELFLPSHLLHEDVDEWTPPRASKTQTPWSERYVIVVRALDRLGIGAGRDTDAEPYVADWARQWRHCATCRGEVRDGRQRPAYCHWLPRPEASYRERVWDGGCIFVLGFKPAREQLDGMLRNGLAAILWRDEAPSKRFMTTLMKAVARTSPQGTKRPCLGDLPHALLHLRQLAWTEGTGSTGGYHLLWDDPTRIPAFTGRRALSTATAEQPPLRLTSPF